MLALDTNLFVMFTFDPNFSVVTEALATSDVNICFYLLDCGLPRILLCCERVMADMFMPSKLEPPFHFRIRTCTPLLVRQ